MTIPLAAALLLLAKAHDVVVIRQPYTASFTFDPALEDFMGLTTTNNDDIFDYVFTKHDNAEVKIEGDVMTLVDDTGENRIEVEMRLMTPMHLTPGAGRGMSEVHQKQCELESNLNHILEHYDHSRRDALGDLPGRLQDIRRHATSAKKAFDWLDNHTTCIHVNQEPYASAPQLLQSVREMLSYIETPGDINKEELHNIMEFAEDLVNRLTPPDEPDQTTD